MELIYKVTDMDISNELTLLNNPDIRYGARGIVINDKGEIALFNKSNKNEYKLPGGGVEENEDLELAFKREAMEETGCEIEIIKKLGTIEEHKGKTNFKQVSHVFVAKVIKDTGKLNLTEKEAKEGAKLMWVKPSEALRLITECYDNLIPSETETLYMSKFIVTRDRKILEYYLENEKNLGD